MRRDGSAEFSSGIKRRDLLIASGAAATCAAVSARAGASSARARAKSGFAEVDGSRIYYEVHGSGNAGRPLVLLHGGMLAIDTAFGDDLLPRLSRWRHVVAIESQGHGHTPDRSTPITEEQLARDVVGVLDTLKHRDVDILGHSLGGTTAIATAMRRPDLVNSIAVLSATRATSGMRPEILAMQADASKPPSPWLASILPTQQDFANWSAHYQRVAPNPAAFQTVMGKLHSWMAEWKGWSDDQLAQVKAPALIAIGDSDFILPGHAAETASLLARGRFAVLPGTTHMGILRRGAWLEPMLREQWARPAED